MRLRSAVAGSALLLLFVCSGTGHATVSRLVVDPLLNMHVGNPDQIASAKPQDSSGNPVWIYPDEVVWSSSDMSVATVTPETNVFANVSHAKVHAVGAGQVTIKACMRIYPGICGQSSITVLLPNPIGGVVFSQSPSTTIPVAGPYTWVGSSLSGCTYNGCDWSWYILYPDGRQYLLYTHVGSGSDSFTYGISNDHQQFGIKVVVSNEESTATTTKWHNATNALDAGISGPYPNRSGWYTYTVVPEGGSGNYTYQWSGDVWGTGPTVTVYLSTCPDSPDFTKHLTVTVTSGGLQYTTSYIARTRPIPDPCAG
jgi:hypothetical protein